MDTMDEIRETFFLECEDLLQDLEAGLSAIRDGDRDPEKVNSVFRAVHSIKGGAGAFALSDLVRFAHKFETTLDEVRAGRLEPLADLVALFLRAADFLADLVASAQSGDQVDGEQIDHLISELESFIDSDEAAPSVENFVFEPIPIDFSLDFDTAPAPPLDGDWCITLSPHENLFARGNDSVLLLRALRLLGDYSVTCDWSDLLLLDHMDCHKSYLKWSLTMPGMVPETAIREVFEFVEDECDLKIERTAVSSLPRPALVETQTQDLIVAATITPAFQDESDHGPSAGTSSDANAKDSGKAPKATVRVELDRVDRLINLIGELVINQSMLSQAVLDAGFPPNSPLAGGWMSLNNSPATFRKA